MMFPFQQGGTPVVTIQKRLFNLILWCDEVSNSILTVSVANIFSGKRQICGIME
jgi:hypothetical protein